MRLSSMAARLRTSSIRLSSALMRRSMLGSFRSVHGPRNSHLAAAHQLCHCAASPSSSTSSGGFEVSAAIAGESVNQADRKRLKPPQARADAFGKFFDLLGLLQAGDGEHMAVVLLELFLELLADLDQSVGVLEVSLVVCLE